MCASPTATGLLRAESHPFFWFSAITRVRRGRLSSGPGWACCGTQDYLFHELHRDSEAAGPRATMRDTNNQELPTLSWPWNTWGEKKKTSGFSQQGGGTGRENGRGLLSLALSIFFLLHSQPLSRGWESHLFRPLSLKPILCRSPYSLIRDLSNE